MYNIERLIRGYKYNGWMSYEEYVEYLIETYNGVLRPDRLCDFPGDVDISGQGLNIVPTIFGIVNGSFKCYNNNFSNLIGSPESVGGNFNCSYNQLQSLDGCPKHVGSSFWCDNNLVQFTEEEVRSRCDVGGRVHV